ncbi:uncharacterized protein LOC131858454 [Cryptomeria japonica]|uniref:uncharacterized protein LOC131858454 n=1 Tax=Cryptomeria japonica TaxID=3369 RepID=UPI0027DA13A4|nr:uncharacterized protein LOC131858454 [Cryptomeria japonica]
MGICISVEGNDVYEPTANVILMDGGIQKFSGPVKVEEILKNNPGHFVFSSDGLYIGKFISEILPQEELQIGQLYFVLPRKKLGRGPEDKKKNVKADEKGKMKVEEIRDQMKKKWVKKTNDDPGSGSAPDSGARISSDNQAKAFDLGGRYHENLTKPLFEICA